MNIRRLHLLAFALVALGSVVSGSAADAKRPNILWLIAEDFSPDLGCYGTKEVWSPNLDRLAAQGMRFNRMFTTAPVCSASRSAFMTGMYQTTIGAHNHRSHRDDGYKVPAGVRPACNPETGYLNVDGSPTKTLILDAHRADAADRFGALCFGRRPGVEYYDLTTDSDCLNNLATEAATAPARGALQAALYAELKAQGDPRMTGDGAIFDRYPHSSPEHVNFYDRYLRGAALKANWVNLGDFEKAPLP